jgi:hypothetical protein
MNRTYLFRCVFRAIKCSSLFAVKRLNPGSAKSLKRDFPPLIPANMTNARYQQVAMMTATYGSKLLGNHPSNGLLGRFLKLEEVILDFD